MLATVAFQSVCGLIRTIAPICILLVLIGLIVCIAIALRLKFQKYKQSVIDYMEGARQLDKKVKESETQLSSIEEKKEKIERWLRDLDIEKNSYEQLIATMKADLHSLDKELTQRRHAAELEITKEVEHKRAIYLRQLEDEFEKLKESSKWQELEEQMQETDRLIALGKKTLAIVEKKVIDQASKENFEQIHSIKFSEQDKNDIKIIVQLCSQLNRTEAIRKFIWTEFYQKPLQELRKDLQLDSTTGIYRITSKRDNRCYIGQSTNIGTRLTDHFKNAIIGKTTVLTTKLYTAMAVEGPENFTYEVLEVCQRDKLNERERYWIDFYDAKALGYNMTIGG